MLTEHTTSSSIVIVIVAVVAKWRALVSYPCTGSTIMLTMSVFVNSTTQDCAMTSSPVSFSIRRMIYRETTPTNIVLLAGITHLIQPFFNSATSNSPDSAEVCGFTNFFITNETFVHSESKCSACIVLMVLWGQHLVTVV